MYLLSEPNNEKEKDCKFKFTNNFAVNTNENVWFQNYQQFNNLTPRRPNHRKFFRINKKNFMGMFKISFSKLVFIKCYESIQINGIYFKNLIL